MSLLPCYESASNNVSLIQIKKNKNKEYLGLMKTNHKVIFRNWAIPFYISQNSEHLIIFVRVITVFHHVNLFPSYLSHLFVHHMYSSAR